MFELLGEQGIDWERTEIFQVDERIAPDGDPDRNLTGALEHLPPAAASSLRAMPVTDGDISAAAARYAAELPEAFDLVHLGLGTDGHTASLVPGDPVLEVVDRDVAVSGDYGGRRRMTFTFPVLDRARFVLWLVTGDDKAEAVERLVSRDASIPAARVRAERQLLVADRAATSRVDG